MDSITNHCPKDEDYFYIMNCKEFLTRLSFYKDRQELEREQLKKINNATQ